jgi:hypothetical protein
MTTVYILAKAQRRKVNIFVFFLVGCTPNQEDLSQALVLTALHNNTEMSSLRTLRLGENMITQCPD